MPAISHRDTDTTSRPRLHHACGDARDGPAPPRDCHFCYLRWRCVHAHERYTGETFVRAEATMSEQGSAHDLLPILACDFTYVPQDTQAWAAKWLDCGLSISFEMIPVKGFSSQFHDRCIEPEAGNDFCQEDTSRSVPTLQTIHHWLQSCVSPHKQCHIAVTGQNPLPTRLIDLGAKSRDVIQPWVCKASGVLPSQTRYATLSHCWGETPPLRLMGCNEDTFRDFIPVSAILRLFREAMEVVCLLGVHYIWIDALRIVQDSASDWAEECTRMADVYSHGLFNIIARDACNSEEPLFSSREHLSVETCRVPARCFRIGETRPRPKIEEYLTTPYYTTFSQCGPTDSRGWIMQEMRLTPRKIFFRRDAVHWDCAACRASETFPKNMAGIGREDQASKADPKFIHGANPIREWQLIVERYSSKTLKYPEKGKLPALAGVAAWFRQIYGERVGQYAAGTWSAARHLNFFWRPLVAPGDRTASSLSAGLRNPGLPSWS